MSERDFDEMAKGLERINSVIIKLDPSIRVEAFRCLAGCLEQAHELSERNGEVARISPAVEDTNSDPLSFFALHAGGKPSDNVILICAYLYSRSGAALLSSSEISQIADDVGLTLPARIDMTMASATRDGKALFKAEGGGNYRLTVHGELYLQRTFNVKKGLARKGELPA